MNNYPTTITVRFDPETRAVIDDIAKREDRKPGAVIRRLIDDGLKLRGLVNSDRRAVEAQQEKVTA